ncbi:unnamed protein product [Adineta ricciae]|uniref:Uncharacterized protein n=2 Tax=Adineta ricciae TaxID=249248 RepID=A0A815L5N5_ADIRI|nr:unnamed protein product [Adineta ricciae]
MLVNNVPTINFQLKTSRHGDEWCYDMLSIIWIISRQGFYVYPRATQWQVDIGLIDPWLTFVFCSLDFCFFGLEYCTNLRNRIDWSKSPSSDILSLFLL